jgi:DNA-binding response OmpR family regulator
MNCKLLLIDDDVLPTDYYFYALKERGFDVMQCEEADTAQDKWRALNPALVILDVMMPPGKVVRAEDTKEGLHSGVLLFERLRRDLPDVPVIILTHLLSAPELFSTENGVRVLLKSHVPPIELADIVQQILSN